MKVIITGVAGYIGGQIALQLRDAGHEVLGIDCVCPPHHLSDVCDAFLLQDFASDDALNWLVSKAPDAVIHCAGASLVGPSMAAPAEYFNNNVVNTIRLLDTIKNQLKDTRLIFSSSAAVYGIPFMNPTHEVDPCDPISPYGESKLMIEKILRWYNHAYNLDFVAFRYFNACGADPQGRHGQAPGATHIIARVLESIRDQQPFTLYGNDHATADGTCVRDYVHVSDIAQAHVMALSRDVTSGIYNLGSNCGTSNHEIIVAAQNITGKALEVISGQPRPGDPATLTASSAKFDRVASWRQYNLTDMISHAWKWYVR